MNEQDEAQQQRGGPAARQTAAQQVTALREELDAYQKAISERLERLAAKVTSAASGTSDPEDVAATVRATMRPIVEGANNTLVNLKARVEDLERKALVAEDGAEAARVAHAELSSRLDSMASVSADGPRTDGELAALADRVQHLATEFMADHGKLYDRVTALEGRANRPAGGEGYQTQLQARLAAVEQRLSTVGAIGELDTLTAPVPDVHRKVLELMRRVEVIGKDRKADAKIGGYAFRGIDQVMDAVGAAMRDVGLVLETQVLIREYHSEQGRNADGKTLIWTSCRLVIRYTFISPEDGSRHSFEMAGEARATDDKATSKAEAMALKYGILQALMVPVEGMPDGDREAPQVFQEPGQGQADSGHVTQPPNTPGPAQDEQRRREFNRAELGRGAKAALDNIGRIPADQREAELTRIRNKIEESGLANFEIDGATLRAHGVAVAATLRPPGGEPGTGF